MTSFKRFSIVLLFLVLSSSAFAQKSSGWSLLFTWDRFNAGAHSIGTVYDIDGDATNMAGIGVEFQLMSQLALQVGLDFGMISSKVDQGTTTTETSGTEFGLSVGPVWYMRGYNVSTVRPYLGATINFGSLSSTTEVGTNKEELSASSFGITVFGGADLEVIEGLRVGAGYGLMYASYPSATRKITGQDEVEGPSGSMFTDVFNLNCKIMF